MKVRTYNSPRVTYLVGKKEVTFQLKYSGVELGAHARYWLGEGDTDIDGGYPTGADPYVHYFRGLRTSSATSSTWPQMPSRTLHIQTSGYTTQQKYDIIGCVTSQVDINYSKGRPDPLVVTEQWKAQRITDQDATHHTDGTSDTSYAAQTYTETSAKLHPADTSVTQSAAMALTNFKYGGSGGTDIVSDIFGFNIRINNTLLPAYTTRATYNNYNSTINRYPEFFALDEQTFQIVIIYRPTDAMNAMWDYFHQDDTASIDPYIYLSRTLGGNTHYYKFTFSTDNNMITDFGGLLNFAYENEQRHTMGILSADLTSLEIQDGYSSSYTGI